jgi:hypothetical protein
MEAPAAEAGFMASDDATRELARGRTEQLEHLAEQAELGRSVAKADARMLIQRGEVHVEVAQPDEAARRFLAAVTAWGGHLQSQQGATYTVRLPAARFEEAFTWLREAGRVLDESRQADDVTEEFVDLGIRLDNAKKGRERLLEILQKADKVEDILKVEAELRRLTEEIERMEGRRKFLADQVAMATLTGVFERSQSSLPPKPRRRQANRFWWINQLGAESLWRNL